MFKDKEEIEEILNAFAEQLKEEDVAHFEIVVCGGVALNILGLVSRTTNDVDVVAIVEQDEKGNRMLFKVSPLNEKILKAAKRIEQDFNLPENWFNSGPTSVMDFGLPEGLMDRVESRKYGYNLIIHFLGRYDQIHFKLYAAVDQSFGKHLDDLMQLKPTEEEFEKASRWCMTHDTSEEFKKSLQQLLVYLGEKDVADRL